MGVLYCRKEWAYYETWESRTQTNKAIWTNLKARSLERVRRPMGWGKATTIGEVERLQKPEVLGIARSQLGHTGKEGHQCSYGTERNQPTNGVHRRLSLGTDRRTFRKGRNWLTLGERKKGSRRKGVLKAYGFLYSFYVLNHCWIHLLTFGVFLSLFAYFLSHLDTFYFFSTFYCSEFWHFVKFIWWKFETLLYSPQSSK